MTTRIIPIRMEGDNEQSVLVARVNGDKVGVGPGTLCASVKTQANGPVRNGDPRVNKLVYNMYRGLLNTKHDKANDIVDSKVNVSSDPGVDERVIAMMKRQAELKEGKMNTAGGPPPPPPPPPFQVAGAGPVAAPKPVAQPTPVRSMPAAPDQGKIPAALAGAMMKDKKPFTYTPGGLDLSEIKDEPQSNGHLVYIQNGDQAPVQSKSFRVLQNAYVDDQGSQESPRTYSGANIPSRSFKALQQMTQDATNEIENRRPESFFSISSPTPPNPSKNDEKRSWRSRQEPSSSGGSTSYRSVSLDPEPGRIVSPTLSESSSRLKEIVQQEKQAMSTRGSDTSDAESYVPSQLLQQIRRDNLSTLKPVKTRPTSWTADKHLSQGLQNVNITGQQPTDDELAEDMNQTAASKQSVLKELTSWFDPGKSLKRPCAAPGRVFKQLQEQYDSFEDNDEVDSRASSSMRSHSSLRDTVSPSFSSEDNIEVPAKTYSGGRVPGRTFRMLQENIDTHPSVLIPRK